MGIAGCVSFFEVRREPLLSPPFDGLQRTPPLVGIIAFSCSSINSYTGRYTIFPLCHLRVFNFRCAFSFLYRPRTCSQHPPTYLPRSLLFTGHRRRSFPGSAVSFGCVLLPLVVLLVLSPYSFSARRSFLSFIVPKHSSLASPLSPFSRSLSSPR